MSRNGGISLLPTYHRRGQSKNEGEPPQERRLRRLSFIQNAARNELVAFVGEFCGTFMFLFIAFAATQVANTLPSTPPNTSNLLYISLAFGFSLGINVWAFYRISGGLFNPAVSQRQTSSWNTLTRIEGNSRPPPDRRRHPNPRPLNLHRPTPLRHVRRSRRLRHPPRTPLRLYSTR